jgi:hypothetical protein
VAKKSLSFIKHLPMGDNDGGRTKSPEELKLEEQVAIARLKNSLVQNQADTDKAVADSRKAAFQSAKDQLSGPDVKALEGTLTSDGTFIESRILARRTMGEAFAALGKALHESPVFANEKPNLVLYNATDFPCIELYVSLKIQLTALRGEYDRINKHTDRMLEPASADGGSGSDGAGSAGEGASRDESMYESMANVGMAGAVGAAAVGAVGVSALTGAASMPLLAGYAGAALLRTAIDVVSLFRVNTDFKNFDLPVDDTALAAEFKQHLPAGWKVWHPAQFPIHTIDEGASDASEFLVLMEQLQENNIRALALLARVNAKVTELNTLKAAEKDVSSRSRLQLELDGIGACVDPINTLNTIYTQLQGVLGAVDAATRASTLTMLLRSERLLTFLKAPGTYVVKLAAVSRGSNKISSSRWRSAKIRHSAGTELNCLVYDPDGQIVFSNTQLKYMPYKDSEAIK